MATTSKEISQVYVLNVINQEITDYAELFGITFKYMKFELNGKVDNCTVFINDNPDRNAHRFGGYMTKIINNCFKTTEETQMMVISAQYYSICSKDVREVETINLYSMDVKSRGIIKNIFEFSNVFRSDFTTSNGDNLSFSVYPSMITVKRCKYCDTQGHYNLNNKICKLCKKDMYK